MEAPDERGRYAPRCGEGSPLISAIQSIYFFLLNSGKPAALLHAANHDRAP